MAESFPACKVVNSRFCVFIALGICLLSLCGKFSSSDNALETGLSYFLVGFESK